MTQYNNVNGKFSNWQLDKLKLATKNKTEVTVRPSSNLTGINETHFPHKLL